MLDPFLLQTFLSHKYGDPVVPSTISTEDFDQIVDDILSDIAVKKAAMKAMQARSSIDSGNGSDQAMTPEGDSSMSPVGDKSPEEQISELSDSEDTQRSSSSIDRESTLIAAFKSESTFTGKPEYGDAGFLRT